MAEIPVEKKSGVPGWLWALLALILLALVVWWFVSQADDAEVDGTPEEIEQTELLDGDDDFGVLEEPNGSEEAATAVAAAGPVEALTGVAALSALGDKIGRNVSMDSAAVNRVIGDEGFTIGEGDNETLVMFDERPTPNTPQEGHVDVNPGSQVKLRGNVRELAVSDLPESVRTDLEGKNPAYIFADLVEVVN